MGPFHYLAESERLEPPDGCPSTVFKTTVFLNARNDSFTQIADFPLFSTNVRYQYMPVVHHIKLA